MTDITLSAQDFETAVSLIEELQEAGRTADATAVYKLIVHAERSGLRPGIEPDDEPNEASA